MQVLSFEHVKRALGASHLSEEKSDEVIADLYPQIMERFFETLFPLLRDEEIIELDKLMTEKDEEGVVTLISQTGIDIEKLLDDAVADVVEAVQKDASFNRS